MLEKQDYRFRFSKTKNETFGFDFFTKETLPENILESLKNLCYHCEENRIFIFRDEKSFRNSIKIVASIEKLSV